MEKKIKVLIVEPGQKPRAAMIENTLEAMQAVVGGYIETVTLGGVRAVLSAMTEERGR